MKSAIKGLFLSLALVLVAGISAGAAKKPKTSVSKPAKHVVEPARTFATARLEGKIGYKKVARLPRFDASVRMSSDAASDEQLKAFFSSSKSHLQACQSTVSAVEDLLGEVDAMITGFLKSPAKQVKKSIRIDFKDSREAVVLQLLFKKIKAEIKVKVHVVGLAPALDGYLENLLIAVLTADTFWQKHDLKIGGGLALAGVAVLAVWKKDLLNNLFKGNYSSRKPKKTEKNHGFGWPKKPQKAESPKRSPVKPKVSPVRPTGSPGRKIDDDMGAGDAVSDDESLFEGSDDILVGLPEARIQEYAEFGQKLSEAFNTCLWFEAMRLANNYADLKPREEIEKFEEWQFVVVQEPGDVERAFASYKNREPYTRDDGIEGTYPEKKSIVMVLDAQVLPALAAQLPSGEEDKCFVVIPAEVLRMQECSRLDEHVVEVFNVHRDCAVVVIDDEQLMFYGPGSEKPTKQEDFEARYQELFSRYGLDKLKNGLYVLPNECLLRGEGKVFLSVVVDSNLKETMLVTELLNDPRLSLLSNQALALMCMLKELKLVHHAGLHDVHEGHEVDTYDCCGCKLSDQLKSIWGYTEPELPQSAFDLPPESFTSPVKGKAVSNQKVAPQMPFSPIFSPQPKTPASRRLWSPVSPVKVREKPLNTVDDVIEALKESMIHRAAWYVEDGLAVVGEKVVIVNLDAKRIGEIPEGSEVYVFVSAQQSKINDKKMELFDQKKHCIFVCQPQKHVSHWVLTCLNFASQPQTMISEAKRLVATDKKALQKVVAEIMHEVFGLPGSANASLQESIEVL